MAQFTIWSEGYHVNEGRFPAFCLGEFTADTFAQACKKAAIHRDMESLFDAQRLTVWGCRLFDNEMDARKSFG